MSRLFCNRTYPPKNVANEAAYRWEQDKQFLSDLGLTEDEVTLIDGGWNGKCWTSYFRVKVPISWWRKMLNDFFGWP